MNLKKIGAAIANIVGVVSGYGRVFAPLTKTTRDDQIAATIEDSLLKISDIVTSVEVMGQTLSIPGIDKARAAGPLAAQVVLRTLLASGRKFDEAKTEKFKLACAGLAGNTADILDCFKEQ